MERLATQINRTSRRMRDIYLVQCLVQHAAASLGILTAMILIDKTGLLTGILMKAGCSTEWQATGIWRDGGFVMPTLSLPSQYLVTMLVLAAVSFLLALARGGLIDFSEERAALALDAALGLKERVTSAQSISNHNLSMAAILEEDALRHCQLMPLKKAFPLSAGSQGPRLPWLALGFAAAVFLVPDLDLLGTRSELRDQGIQKKEEREGVKKLAQTLRERAKLLKEQARQNKMNAQKLEELTKKMETLAKKLEDEPEIDKKKATAQLRRLEESLKNEATKDDLPNNKLKRLTAMRSSRSLLKKTVRDMQDNNMRGAAGRMRRLRRKLATNTLKKEELDQLTKDMDEMSKKLKEQGLEELSKSFEDMADQLKAMQSAKQFEKMEEMKKRLADALKKLKDKGLDTSELTDEEKDLLRQLQELAAKMEYTEKQMEKMAEMSEQGKMRRLTAEDLRRMLEQMKNGNNGNCPRCTGGGWLWTDKDGNEHDPAEATEEEAKKKEWKKTACPECNKAGGMMGIPMGGNGQGSGQGGGQGSGQRSGSGQGGPGQGQGGVAREKEDETSMVNTKLSPRRIDRGMIVGQWFVRGLPPSKKKLKTEYTEAVKQVAGSSESVREREAIPREDRDFVREYHNRIKHIE